VKILDHTDLRQPTSMYDSDQGYLASASSFSVIDEAIESLCYTPPGLEDVPDHRPDPPGPKPATEQSVEDAVRVAMAEIRAGADAPDMVGLV
jgi:hypothetical protein